MPEAVLAGVQTLTVVVDSLCLDCFHVFPEFHQFQVQVPVHPSSFQTKQSQLTYAGQHLCARDDAFYLLQFKKGLTVVDQNIHDCDNETRAKTLSWNVTGDCCQWDGVTCNGFTGHVIGLDLSCSILNQTINANSSLTKLGHLQRLNLAFSQFDDDFPLGISELSSLTHLNLLNTGFNEGEIQIPPGLSKLSKLVSLDLSSNDFQVGRTTSRSLLQNLTNLEALCLISIGVGTSILELDFFYTDIFGKVPDSIGNLRSLWYLDLSLNRLSGLIPVSIGNLSGIRVLRLSSNSFTGNVPSTISKLNKLVDLDLSFNDFQGSILESIGNLTAITKLTLSVGDLDSEFPFPELRIFELSVNGFTGTFPSNIFKSFRGMMDVDEGKTGITLAINRTHRDYLYHVSLVIKLNEFDMRITSIMTSVDLSRNRNCKVAAARSIIDLSWNRLIGEVPGQLSSLTFLEVLNLSYNHLAGRIRIGKQFNTFPDDSYCGNLDLCGFPLSKKCGNNNRPDESTLEQDDEDAFFASGFTWEAVVIGYGMIFGLLMGGLMFLLEKPKWFVNFAEDISQQIAAKKRRNQKKRRQGRGLRMN
ncbi:receptor-like protein 53 [Solanum verrucosum]|uniref:receptor-like protein 53 n=1 Tax=Solanum verrucosum TaxID=315347 RepID=UPI0020D11F03|nr:receptor-like protein 53 [Solanum verrucosum]